MDEYKCEVLIIGAGPAGFSAGLYSARANRDIIILEGKELSALAQTKELQNWPGEIDIKGEDLLAKFRAHVEVYSEKVRIIKGDVIALMLGMGVNMTSTRTANITSDCVIIATGRGHRKEIIKGESTLLGYGVSYCALCDGPLYKDRVIYLYGNDEEMLEDALTLQQMGCIVHVITNVGIDKLPDIVNEVKNAGIEVIDNSEVIEAIPNSEGIIQKIIVRTSKSNSEETEELKEFNLNALFILSHISSNSIFRKAGIDIDEKGNIKVDRNQKTNLEGVYAAGDCTGGHFQVVYAASEGARAGISAAKYLRQLKKD